MNIEKVIMLKNAPAMPIKKSLTGVIDKSRSQLCKVKHHSEKITTEDKNQAIFFFFKIKIPGKRFKRPKTKLINPIIST